MEIRSGYSGQGVPEFPQNQHDTINSQLAQLKQTLENYESSLRAGGNPQQLKADYQKILDGLMGPDGAFREQLKSVGVTNSAEIDAILKTYQSIPGIEAILPVGTAQVEKKTGAGFIDQLASWEKSQPKTAAAGSITSIQPTATDPFGYAGSARFIYENKSGRPDDQIYIQVVGTNPLTNKQCFIKYNPDGTFKYIDVPTTDKSETFANRLSDFPKSGDGRAIYLPVGGGMRLYTSLGSPVHMDTTKDAVIQPDPHVKDHPGWTMPWDKVEFNIDWGTLLQNAKGLRTENDLNNLLKVSSIRKDYPNLGVVFINPTAVDKFSLPLFVDAARHGGSKTQPGGSILQEGGITSPPGKVFNDFRENVKKITTGDATLDGYIQEAWKGLFIGKGESTSLLSPMDGAATGHFPTDFFVKTGWVQKFEKIFSATPMKIDMNESGGNGIWEMKINPATHEATFTCPGHKYSPLTLKFPSDTHSLLSGTGKGWGLPDPPDLPPNTEKIGLERALVRNLSVAIDTNTITKDSFLQHDASGKLILDKAGHPIPGLCDATGKLILDSNGHPIVGIGTEYFKYMHRLGRVCVENPEMKGGPQFINPYAMAIHGNAPNGQVYAGPYSDEEGVPGAAAQRMADFEIGHIVLGPMT